MVQYTITDFIYNEIVKNVELSKKLFSTHAHSLSTPAQEQYVNKWIQNTKILLEICTKNALFAKVEIIPKALNSVLESMKLWKRNYILRETSNIAIKGESNPTTPIAKKLSLNDDCKQVKQKIEDILEYLKGRNAKNQIIMEQNEYDHLIELTLALVCNHSVPENDSTFALPGISTSSIRYSYYEVMRITIATGHVDMNYIDFLHKFFPLKFRGSEPETTKKKFSTKPKIHPY